MAHPSEVKREAVALMREGASVRETSRRLGVSPASVKSWFDEAQAAEAAGHAALTAPAEEAEVAALIMTKVQLLLAGIEQLPTKAQAERAQAVDRLVTKYLALMGRSAESHVTVTHEGEADLASLLAQLTRAN